MTRVTNAVICSIVCILFSLTSVAQESDRAQFKKGGIEFGGDYFRASGSSSSSGFFPSAGAGFFAINFRPLRNLQIDAIQAEFIAPTNDGQGLVIFNDGTQAIREIKGHPSLIAFGARFVLPLSRDKVLFSVGGGWSGLQTSESVQSNSGEQIACSPCQSLRGWGPTEIAEVMYFPGDQRNVGFGLHVRGVQIITNGLAIPDTNISGKDHVLLIGGSVSIRFK